MPKWGRRVDVGGGIALGVVSRDVSAWILAFARMTNSGGPELWLGTANCRGGFCHRPTPTPAGDKPLASRSLRPRYICSFRHRPSVYNSARFAR